MQTGTLHQSLLPHFFYDSRIRLHRLAARQWGSLLEHFSDDASPVCGVSMRLSKDHGGLDGVAFATPTDVFYANFACAEQDLGKSNLARVLDGSLCVLVGFGMPRLALHLHRQCGLHVKGVELSTLFTFANKKFQTAADFASRRIHPDVNRSRIHAAWYGDDVEDVCLRAWLSSVLGTDSFKEVQCAAKVDTRNLPDSHLACLSRLLLNVELLEGERPTEMENEFDGVDIDTDGQLVIRNSRYNTRVRKSKQTSIIMETTHGQNIVGHAVHAEGKQTGVKVAGGNFRGKIERIRVVGREELTSSEIARDEFILLLLQGTLPSLVDSPFIRMLWFPTEKAPRGYRLSSIPPLGPQFAQLNPSQNQVVAAMLAQDEPLVVVHGKTTTIAAALHSWEREWSSAWVIAQSNVGVQNIADTLLKHAIDFKLLVSKEFYVEWHEHLYKKLEGRFVRSDELFADAADVERMLGSSSLILCTISMLSNPAIDNCGIFDVIPVERLIVDEASQIDTFEFMHLFHKFRRLEKVCMFGDPKQLPPYGKETAPQMKTIYDFKHLKASAYFLNTQYRMPALLGEFISEYVYDKKLLSVHPITDFSAVLFVDVRKGQEERVGSSWKNTEEARAVVNIVKNHYKTKDFCIITPYDAQRAEIARQLKAEGLQWDKVFNVDSFQGHEAQYVVISAVRTEAPGFLRSRNRANVMLTRCKRGMVLVSKRDFLIGPGRTTLLGELAQRWNRGVWRSENVWINALELSDGRASLPGVPGRPAVMGVPSPSPFQPASSRTTIRTPAMSFARDDGSTPRPRASSWATVVQANFTPKATAATRSAELGGPLRSGRVTPNDPPNLPPSTGLPTRAIQLPYSAESSPAAGPPLMLPSVPVGWPGRNRVLTASEPPKLASKVETLSLRAEQPNMFKPKLDAEGEFPSLAPSRSCKPQAQPQAALKGKWQRGSEACRL
ncbi:hypothetical protein VTO73DRAFT_8937 [Trametes versicolor]